MTATSRQTTLLRRPLGFLPEAAGPRRHVLLLLVLVLSGLLRPERPLAATVTVVARQSDRALGDSDRHARLAVMVPNADVATSQPRPEPLPLLPAPLPTLPLHPALVVRPVLAAGRSGGQNRAHRWVTTCLTSEVPNGP